MKLLISSLVALLLAVAIGSLTGSDNGHVVLTLSEWTMQTSATFFIIALFVSFITLYLIIRGLAKLLHVPTDIKIRQRHRHQRRAEKYLTQGLIDMTEGRWRQAERAFCKAASYSRSPYVNYLCAARAAQESGSIDKRDEYLHLAYQDNPDASLAVGITQAELQLSQHQTEQALATLKHLQHKTPDQVQVKQLLLDTCTDLHDWKSVLKLIPSIEKSGIYSREQVQAKQLEAFAGLLREAGKLQDKKQLNDIWHNIPRKLKQHFYLIEVYVTERLRFPDTADCEKMLRGALKKQWDSILIRLYGLVVAIEPAKQLTIAESYLESHAHDAMLLLTLGRICKTNSLWGKTRDYLQESINIKPNPEAYYEFAKLHEQDGNQQQAAICYKKGLELATAAK